MNPALPVRRGTGFTSSACGDWAFNRVVRKDVRTATTTNQRVYGLKVGPLKGGTTPPPNSARLGGESFVLATGRFNPGAQVSASDQQWFDSALLSTQVS